MVKDFPAPGLQSQGNSCFLPREKRGLNLFWDPEDHDRPGPAAGKAGGR